MLTGLAAKLQSIDMNVMWVPGSPSRGSDEALRILLSYQPDIAIMPAAPLPSAAAQACHEVGTPVIFFNRQVAGGGSWAVTCDNVRGPANRRFPHRPGPKRLACIAGRPHASTNVERWRGFSSRCARRGIPVPIGEEARAFSYQAGYAAAQRLRARGSRPDANFAASDIVAFGVVDAARGEFGLKIPQDLSVVGFDDISMASWPAYSLTTLRQPADAMIESTVDLVQRLTRRSTEKLRVIQLAGELIVRGTTRTLSKK